MTSSLIGELTPYSFPLLVALFFMLGWIRPRSAITDLTTFYEARIKELREENENLREAHRVSEEVRVTQRDTIRDALELMKLYERGGSG